MRTNGITGLSANFAREFGDALAKWLADNDISQAEAARRMGLEVGVEQRKKGRAKSRINSYCKPSRNGQNRSPDAQILCLACVRLGFKFRYNGHLISAQSFEAGEPTLQPLSQQLTFEFDRQFKLTNKQGTVSVTVKRPPGRIDLSVSLAAGSV